MNRVLVAGLGNIFLGDDGFGVEVAQRLSQRPQPEGVQVADFGIRAIDLSYALQEGYVAAILVDTAQRGGLPGSLYVIEPNEERPADAAGPQEPSFSPQEPSFSPHEMDPNKVLRLAQKMGGECGHIVVVACEPESFGTETDGCGRMSLSAPVAAAVNPAIELIESLTAQLMESPTAERQAQLSGGKE